MASSLHDTFALPTYVCGVLLIVMMALVIFGGLKRIAAVADLLVPIMALSYIAIGLFVIASNFEQVPGVLMLIVKSAFGLEPAFAGSVGAAIMMGVKRGLFSNEAGLGTAPNVAAVAEVKHPVAQGVVQSFSVFIDTMIICTCTAMIVLLSGVYEPGSEMGGVVLAQAALAAEVGEWGRVFISVALLLFAFTTLLYSYYVGENALGYFSGKRWLLQIFRVLVIAQVFWGSVQDLGTVFGFADLTMGLLAFVNLLALMLLFKVGLRLMRDYDDQVKEGIRQPVFDPKGFADLELDPAVWKTPQVEASPVPDLSPAPSLNLR